MVHVYLFWTSRKNESVLFICSSYMARRMGKGAFKASWVISIGGGEKHFRFFFQAKFCCMSLLAVLTWKQIFVSSSRPSKGSGLLTSVSSAQQLEWSESCSLSCSLWSRSGSCAMEWISLFEE